MAKAPKIPKKEKRSKEGIFIIKENKRNETIKILNIRERITRCKIKRNRQTYPKFHAPQIRKTSYEEKRSQ